MKMIHLLLASWLLAGVGSRIAQATAIVVANASFESPVLADGGFYVGAPPGWASSPEAQNGVQNPINSQFAGSSDPGSGVPDGKQMAWLNMVGTLSQVLAATLQANTDYTLTVSVGLRLDQTAAPYAVELHAGTNVLGSASPTLVSGQFVTAAVTYHATANDPLIGQPLAIVFSKSTSATATQVDFDNVQLDATPATIVSLTAIVITNASFELPVLADGGYFVGPPPGWTMSPGSQNGVENPLSSEYPGASDPGSGLPDGKQMGWMNMAGTMSQVLAATLQANTDYTLAVSVGLRLDETAAPYAVELHAGTSVLGSASPTLVSGQFVTATVNYHAAASDPLIGQHLAIVFSKSTSTSATQVDFDNVQLAAKAGSGGTPLPALVAHWKFDETSGTVAADVTGAHPGQLTASGASFVPGGISGGALKLDMAQNGYVAVPHISELATDAFTVVAWAKLSAGDAGNYFLFGQHEDWFENGFLMQLNTGPSGASGWGATGKASVAENDGWHAITSTTTINDGQWHQIVLTYANNGSSSVYVDGAPAEGTIPAIPLIDRGAPFLIGGRYGEVVTNVSQGFYTGWVDDVQVYATALTGDLINLLFSHPGKNLLDLGITPITVSIRAIPQVSWNSVPGAAYTVLRKPSVSATDWDVIVPVLVATNTTSQYIDAEAPSTAIYEVKRNP